MRHLAPAEFTESLALALGVEPAQVTVRVRVRVGVGVRVRVGVRIRVRVRALTLNHPSPSPSPGPRPGQYALGRSMVFFRLGAAAALLALDDIDNDAALRQTLRDSISAFARLGLG